MEQQDFTPIGGNWAQDAAYSLRQIIQQASDLLQKFDENSQLITSGITQSESNILSAINQSETNVTQAIDDKPIVVEVTTYNTARRETLYVYNPLPIIKPQPKQQVVYRRETIQPAPRVIDTGKQKAYGNVCSGMKHYSDEIKCRECVDRWLEEHKEGFTIFELNATRSFCRIEKLPYSAVSSKCNPPTSIVDRAAVKRYRECMARSK